MGLAPSKTFIEDRWQGEFFDVTGRRQAEDHAHRLDDIVHGNQMSLATLLCQVSWDAQRVFGVQIPKIEASHRQPLLPVAFAQ